MIRRGPQLVLLALALAASGCASHGVLRPQPFPQPAPASPATPAAPAPAAPSPSPHAPAAHVKSDELAETALSLVGRPYKNAGMDPSGFDCSGLVCYVFGVYGIDTPRSVRGLYDAARPVREEDVAPGDLLFFTTTGPGPTHVAIAIGGGRFVHAPSSGGRVRVEALTSAYWSARYLGARRIPGVPAS